jgi:hypothetical protein
MSIVNANVNVSEMVSLNVPSSVLNMLTNIARDVVQSCAARHGFDAEEEMRFLGLDVGLVVELKKGKKVVVEKKVSSTTSEEEGVVGVVGVVGVEKSFRGTFPLPYNGGQVVSCCSGLKENHGLMTQCQNGRKGDDKLCKTCDNQASKNENGLPTYGTIEMRNACGIFEYVAPNGKSPVAYSKVMKKLNLSMVQVVDEAAKRNMVMDDGHFVEVDSKRGRPSKSTTENATSTSDDEKKSSVKGKGRPRSVKKVVESVEPSEDLFAVLLATSKEVVKPANKVSKKKAAVEEVAVEKVAEVAEVAVEEVKVAEVAEVKVAVEKVAEVKETKVKKAVAKIESKKAEPVPVPVPVQVPEVKEAVEETDDEEEDDEDSDSVTRFEYKGVKYLKSSNTGVIYNMDEDVVGKWNEKTKEIDFHDVEEEEEEYDEE